MVDAENLLLFEELAYCVVDGAVRGQIVAQGLLEYHAGFVGV